MTFPCLICGDLPIVTQPTTNFSSPSATAASSSPSLPYAARGGSGGGATGNATLAPKKVAGSGTTIRTLSKDVSDKIFQNLCRHLYIKTEPYWFIQNPGEQMPLCAVCSGTVLEIYTLQSKIDQFQAEIKKHVWKVERMVADTEIASNWMATRDEQESEEAMWNNLPCPPMAIRIARERHHKFRLQILQNFKRKVKLRQKMRASGHQNYELMDMDSSDTTSATDPVFSFNGDKSENRSSPLPPKRSRLDENLSHGIPARSEHGPMSTTVTSRLTPGAIPISIVASSKRNQSNVLMEHQQQLHSGVKIPSSIAISAARVPNEDFVNESDRDYSDSDNNSQVYPDVQIVCSADPVDFLKEETENDYSNSGDGEESTYEQDGMWSLHDDNVEGDDPMQVREGEEAVWLAPDVALSKSFVDKLVHENLKPSVFLRKLTFALFGLKQLANSSGICGSSKPGSKPSVDRYKFEALREYTVDTYGIRDNFNELDDLNRKIRTICCDARKALKRRMHKPPSQVTLHPSPSPSTSTGIRGGGGGIIITPLSEAFNMNSNLSEERDEDFTNAEGDYDQETHPTPLVGNHEKNVDK